MEALSPARLRQAVPPGYRLAVPRATAGAVAPPPRACGGAAKRRVSPGSPGSPGSLGSLSVASTQLNSQHAAATGCPRSPAAVAVAVTLTARPCTVTIGAAVAVAAPAHEPGTADAFG